MTYRAEMTVRDVSSAQALTLANQLSRAEVLTSPRAGQNGDLKLGKECRLDLCGNIYLTHKGMTVVGCSFDWVASSCSNCPMASQGR